MAIKTSVIVIQLRHRYRQGWRFLTLWEGFGVEEATWVPFSAFVLPEGRLNSVLVDYLSQNNLGELLRLAETLASKTKARDWTGLPSPKRPISVLAQNLWGIPSVLIQVLFSLPIFLLQGGVAKSYEGLKTPFC